MGVFCRSLDSNNPRCGWPWLQLSTFTWKQLWVIKFEFCDKYIVDIFIDENFAANLMDFSDLNFSTLGRDLQTSILTSSTGIGSHFWTSTISTFCRNLVDDDLICLLVMRVYPQGLYFACVVDQKGYDHNAIKAAAQFLSDCGLTEFVYRADREKALSKFLAEMIDTLASNNIKGTALTGDELENSEGDTSGQGDIAEAETPASHDLV